MYNNFVVSFEFRKCVYESLTLLFSFNIILAILLCFHMNFKIILSVSKNSKLEIFIEIALNLYRYCPLNTVKLF